MNIKNLEIYTIGHSNLPIETFVGLLENNKIEEIIDIRSVPYSRFYPQYNREALNQELKCKGISYTFSGNLLGGRIADISCYKDKVLPTRKVNIAELIDYEALIQKTWFQDGIQQLLDSAVINRICIMCSEEDPSRCHRNLLVARRLIEKSVGIIHIRSNGRLDSYGFEQKYTQLKLF